jgi:hypothetical protein
MRQNGEATKIGLRLAAGAIFVAPFIALLYRAEAGLVVMAAALGAVSLLLRDAIGLAPQHARRRLRLVLGFNLVLAGSCLALAAVLFARGSGAT